MNEKVTMGIRVLLGLILVFFSKLVNECPIQLSLSLALRVRPMALRLMECIGGPCMIPLSLINGLLKSSTIIPLVQPSRPGGPANSLWGSTLLDKIPTSGHLRDRLN